MRLYLGTHEPHWLADASVPMFVSRPRLVRRRPTRPATAPWALDSGGYFHLRQHGRWTISPTQYADEIAEWSDVLGPPDWCAPQDWMCEPDALEQTGLSIAEHQVRTVESFLHLRCLGAPVIPVLQGWTLDDYDRCHNLYRSAGIDLTHHEVVGVGTLCRQAAASTIVPIVQHLAASGIRIHAFGVKGPALARLSELVVSADSLAWSYAGARRGPCIHLRSRCANHRHYAEAWWHAFRPTSSQPALF